MIMFAHLSELIFGGTGGCENFLTNIMPDTSVCKVWLMNFYNVSVTTYSEADAKTKIRNTLRVCPIVTCIVAPHLRFTFILTFESSDTASSVGFH